MNRTRGFPSTTGIHPKEFDICADRPVISVAMSAIAQAIADHQNEIDRLQAKLASGFWTLLRTEGMPGDSRHDLTWRWTETAEGRLLATAVDE